MKKKRKKFKERKDYEARKREKTKKRIKVKSYERICRKCESEGSKRERERGKRKLRTK